MPDMTLCANEDCPLKEGCYRYMALDTDPWQSYYYGPYNSKTGKCEDYIPMEKEKKK